MSAQLTPQSTSGTTFSGPIFPVDATPQRTEPTDEPWGRLARPTVQDITTLAWVRDLRNERIRRLADSLTAAGVEEFEILPTGSTCNGHYLGPKGRDASWAKVVPSEYDQLVEIDLRLVLPEKVSLRDTQLLNRLRAAIRSQSEYVETLDWESLTEWDDKPDAIFFYRHEPLIPEQKIGLEWEIGVYREPVCPIDQYWESVFSADEIAWQRELRRIAMIDGPSVGLDYKEHFWLLKRAQCHFGISRVTAALAVPEICSKLGSDGKLIMDIFENDFDRVRTARTPNLHVVRPHIDRFLRGAHPYSVLQTEWPSYTPPVIRQLFADDTDIMRAVPLAPRWVRFSHALHAALRTGQSELDFSSIMLHAQDGADN